MGRASLVQTESSESVHVGEYVCLMEGGGGNRRAAEQR